MTTKEKLLSLLESGKGSYFSGEDIAGILGISRAAVWKAVNALRNDGYPIGAVTNRGYCLSENSDILSSQGIRQYLSHEAQKLHIQVVDSVESTNTAVREQANQGQPEGYVLVAGAQTAGKGRMGRSFFSPAGTGVYLSILLRPQDCPPGAALNLTTMAAVAMCEAIEAVSGKQASIKWVNDIFVEEKKVCGILTEGSFNMESGVLDYAVLGVGVNLYLPEGGFPGELEQIAGSLFELPGNDLKNRLTGEFLNRLLDYYCQKDPESYTPKYRARSLVVGRKITVLSSQGSRNATALGIDDACRLLVQYENGETARLSYGEIRIQL